MVARGGYTKLHKVKKAQIKLMHPLFFTKVIYQHNGKYFNGKRLIIKIIRRTKKMTIYSTRAKDGGYCPDSFFRKIFGNHNSLLRISKDGNEYDVFNCYIFYNDHYGTFTYGFDLAWRPKQTSMIWQSCKGPMITLPQ